MTKRIISVLLALVLVLALAMPVLAEAAGYTLTINDKASNREYKIYQIFTGAESKDDEGNKLFVEAEFGNGINKTNLLNLLGCEDDATKAVEAFAEKYNGKGKLAADDLKKNGCLGTALQTKTTGADEKGVTFDNLPYGYYFVEETTTLANKDDAASAFILQIADSTSVNTKRTDIPKVEKDQNEEDKTYYVGKEIIFTLKSAIPSQNYTEYDKYYFEFQDTMSEGLDYDTTYTPVVKINGETDTTGIFTMVNAEGQKNEDGTTTLKWVCNDTIAAGLDAGDKITVEYKAKLNANAVVGGEGNDNTVKVIYSNNPEDGGEGKSETTPDTEVVFCIDLDGLKIDGDSEEALGDAIFVLKNEKGEFYKVENKIVSWVESEDAATKMTSNATTGAFGFTGLEAGEYTLVETKAPAGYNALEPVDFKIVAEEKDGKVVFSTTVISSTLTHDEEGDALQFTVANNKGTTLPETGGIGTTIFYLVGGLMMAAAVVLLVAKKRTVNE